ncbi:MAG: glycosyltransferase family 4 protein [Bryobacteraceae bacterium]
MKVGYYSPLPPERTGVADYSAALLAELRKLGEVEVGGDRDVSLYHIGNNGLHREIYRRAIERPGIAVLHDAVLQHFFLGSLDAGQYEEEFVYNYGEWHRDLARDLWSGRARSAADPRYFAYPMLRRIAECSRAVIVHNPGAAAIVARHAPRARVVEIPHLFQTPGPLHGSEPILLRSGWGLPARAFVFGVFGHLRESKRLTTVLRAFTRVKGSGAPVALLIAGEFASSDLARALEPMLRQPGILRAGYTPDPEFWRLAHAVDACINLRYPPAGETSGIAIRMMGIGKPVVVTDGPEVSRYPEAACVRVESGACETEMLAAAMEWLARHPEDAREIGIRARAHILEHHRADVVARRYRAAVESAG